MVEKLYIKLYRCNYICCNEEGTTPFVEFIKPNKYGIGSKKMAEDGVRFDGEFQAGSDGQSLSADGGVKFTCGITENLGFVHVTGTGSPLIPQKAQVALYPGPIGSDPNKGYLDYWWIEDLPKQTDYVWGTGYYVGVSIKDEVSGDYVLVCSAGPS